MTDQHNQIHNEGLNQDDNINDPHVDQDWTTDPVETQEVFVVTKANVTDYDIFKLAKLILLWSAISFLSLAALRIFYPVFQSWSCKSISDEGMKEVWDYSKVILNSIVSLVLGLYFGSKQSK